MHAIIRVHDAKEAVRRLARRGESVGDTGLAMLAAPWPCFHSPCGHSISRKPASHRD